MIFQSGNGQVDSVRTNLLPQLTVSSVNFASSLQPVSFKNLDSSFLASNYYGQEPAILLSQTPSFTYYTDAGSLYGYSYFRLRGIDQTRINMTLDGVPLNEPEDQGVYFSNYPDFFNSLRLVQIQRGAGTNNNGVANYAGSLLFESEALNYPKTEVGLSIGSYTTYRAYASYNTGIKKYGSLYIRGSFLHSDGYKERSAHSSGSVFYSYRWAKGRNVVKITGFAGDQRNQLAWLGATMQQLDSNPRFNANGNENDHFTQTLNFLQHSFFINANWTLRSTVYYNYLNGHYNFDPNTFVGLPTTGELINYAFRSHFAGGFSSINYHKGAVDITSGVHANHYERMHTGSDNFIGQLYTNTGYKNEFDAFAKLTYDWRHTVLFADLQYRFTDFIYKGDVALPAMQWNFFNPRIGLVENLKGGVQLYYDFGYTQREPTRNDIFNGADNLTADSAGNPETQHLKPESVIDNELGVKYSFAGGHINCNLFYMWFKDEIALNGQFGPNGLPLHSDVAHSFRSGIEIDAIYEFRFGLKLINNSSFSYCRSNDGSQIFQPLLTPPVIINQGIGYHYKNFRTLVSCRYQSGSYIDYANANKIDKFYVMDITLAYRIRYIELGAHFNNITNQKYFTAGEISALGQPVFHIQSPFNYLASIKWVF